LTLDEILARLESDRDRHLTQCSSAAEVEEVERTLGLPLPAPFRTLLMQVGAGILYNAHEVFGPRRVIIHDIELVPDLVTMQPLLRQGRPWPDRCLAFHRGADAVHGFDLGRTDGTAPVLRLEDPSVRYPDLASFLAAVVLPKDPPPAG
jgi:SMI1/KNR4 family protein SUKH-1